MITPPLLFSQRIQTAIKAANAGGKATLSIFGQTNDVQKKDGILNYVTKGDLSSEKAIMDVLKNAFPQDYILSEETKNDLTKEELMKMPHVWVIDPIDGTVNYKVGKRYAGVSVGLLENGVSVGGAICDIFSGDLFYGEKDKGVFLNGKQVHVTENTDLMDGILTFDVSYNPDETRTHLEMIQKLDPIPRILSQGSSVMAMAEVVAGRTDVYFHTGLKPWDNAAAFPLIEEAGGIVVDLKGNPIDIFSPEMVVGNPKLVRQFLDAQK